MGGEERPALLVCADCGRAYEEEVFACSSCGGLTVFEYPGSRFNIDRREPGIWRYRSLLPRLERVVSKGEGLTPVSRLGGVLAKNEQRNPTSTYSDRASSVIASYLSSRGVPGVRTRFEEDFTYSLVYYLEGVSAVEVVLDDPLSLDRSDVALLARARNVRLTSRGSSSDLVDLSYLNPLTVEGLKTIAFEIYERGLRVERVVVPARTGLLAYSVWKGFRDLEEAGAEPHYEVVAASIKGSGRPRVLDRAKSVRVVEVDGEEVLEFLARLWNRGVSTKPLSASAFAVAENLGSSVAVVTIGFRAPSGGRSGSAGLRREIVRVLESYGEATAYEIWRRLPVYTLRGTYKLLESMERRGEVCSEVRPRGERKVRYYIPCGSPRPERAATS